jgi:hypothetical protein
MRRLACPILLILASSMFLHCSDNDAITDTGSIHDGKTDFTVEDLDQYIEIGHGQAVLIESENLTVEFRSVISDSRCPADMICFWPGQAEVELWLSRPGGLPDRAVPVLMPGRNPDVYPYLTASALGYRIYLLALEPYPRTDRPLDPGAYIATLRIEKIPGGQDNGDVALTWARPFALQVDDLTVLEGAVTDDTLTLMVYHGGGCGDHAYKLFWRGEFMESYPVQVNLYVQHINHNDFCEALITRNVQFDVRVIAEAYEDLFGGYDDIIMNVYGYFREYPGQKIQVTYSPE